MSKIHVSNHDQFLANKKLEIVLYNDIQHHSHFLPTLVIEYSNQSREGLAWCLSVMSSCQKVGGQLVSVVTLSRDESLLQLQMSSVVSPVLERESTVVLVTPQLPLFLSVVAALSLS